MIHVSRRQVSSFAVLSLIAAVIICMSVYNEVVFRSPPRHIFFDFGSSDGSSIDTFLSTAAVAAVNSSTAMDGSQRNRGVLRSFAAAGSNVLWEVHAFEANPNQVSRLEGQRKRLTAAGRIQSYTLWKATAIATFDGVTQFIFDNQEEGSAGSTTNTDSLSAVGTRITVNAVDVVTLFTTTLRLRPEDTVVVKVDIEGAEYALLRRIIHKGLLPLIDHLAVEWHEDVQYVFAEPDRDTLRTIEGQERKAIHDKYKFQRKALMWMLEEGGKEKLSSWG